MTRITLGRIQNPVRAMLHGTAAVASVVGLAVLLSANRGAASVSIALAVYAGSLATMYTVSALYHAVPWSERWKDRMRRVDHAVIFLLVAGTYTPIAVVVLDGAWQAVSLALVWSIALVGITLKFVLPRIAIGLSITLQMVMGWAAVVPMFEIGRRLGAGPILWIIAGGVLYTVGMVLFVTRRPRLFPRVFSYHEMFHVCVVAASLAHFVFVFRHVLPLA